MIHHDIRYRRFTRRNAIQRKRKIAVSSFCFSHEYLADPRHVGQWAKGKVHCSCPLCACKSTKVIGKRTNSQAGYSVSDLRKFDTLIYRLKEVVESVQ